MTMITKVNQQLPHFGQHFSHNICYAELQNEGCHLLVLAHILTNAVTLDGRRVYTNIADAIHTRWTASMAPDGGMKVR